LHAAPVGQWQVAAAVPSSSSPASAACFSICCVWAAALDMILVESMHDGAPAACWELFESRPQPSAAVRA
jgi:hypothetical protein